jgi:signal transduction histidine kinase
VHGIVDDMNGIIDVQSALESGSTFRVLLPAYRGHLDLTAQTESR